jgi:hypothetical protein
VVPPGRCASWSWGGRRLRAVEGRLTEFLGGSHGESEPPGLGVYVADEGTLCMRVGSHGTMKAPANAASPSGTRDTRVGDWPAAGSKAATRKSKVARMSKAKRKGDIVVRELGRVGEPVRELAPSCRTRQQLCRLRSGWIGCRVAGW